MRTIKGKDFGPVTLDIHPTAMVYPCATIDISGNVRIGPHCEIEDGVYIWSHRHRWGHSKGPRREIQEVEQQDVDIGEDVFIGTNAQLISCQKVGDGAVIGAGSIVTHDVPAYEVWAGNPARKIRVRGD